MRHSPILALPAILSLAALAAPALHAQTAPTFPSLVYGTWIDPSQQPQNLLLDLYVPTAPAGPFPVLVWIHGGGWQAGSRANPPLRLLQRGYAIASIDYRLSGQAVWPAQIHDCKAAIRFLRANAATWNLDPDRIGAFGTSAGGHLVAALGALGGVGAVRVGSTAVDLEGTVGSHPGTSSRVQVVHDLYGPTNMLHAHDFLGGDHDAPTSPESRLIGGALQQFPDRWATVDPIPWLSPDDAPLLLMHGTADTVVPFHQSELLYAAARAVGVEVQFWPVPDNGHGGPGFFTPEATAFTDAFLDRWLRDLPPVTVRVQAVDAEAREDGDPARFRVARTGGTAAPLTVRLCALGDVEPGVDCDGLPLLLTIPAGALSADVPLQPRDDLLVEGDERATLAICPSPDYRIDAAAASADAMLRDDEDPAGLPVVTVTAPDPAAAEAGLDAGLVQLQRTGALSTPLTVRCAIHGTADQGTDVQSLPTSVTFAIGAATAALPVVPVQDGAPEAGETVIATVLPGPDHARGAAVSAHVVLADDDRLPSRPIVCVLTTDVDAGEPARGGVFSLTRTGPFAQPLVVHYTLAGRAVAGADYQALPGVATIRAQEAWVHVPVAPLDDQLAEGPEDIVLRLLPDPAYAIGTASSGRLWLADDDVAAPAPSPLQLAVGPLRTGARAQATLTGASAGAFFMLWLAPAPGWLEVPPFGVVLLDPASAAPWTAGLADSGGSSTVPIDVPQWPALAGAEFTWQAFAVPVPLRDGALSAAMVRVLAGPPPR